MKDDYTTQLPVEHVLNFPTLPESKFSHVLTKQGHNKAKRPTYKYDLSPTQVKQLLDILSVESLQLASELPPGVHVVPPTHLAQGGTSDDGFVVRWA